MKPLLVAAFAVFALTTATSCDSKKKSKKANKVKVQRDLGEPCKASSECTGRNICLHGTCAPSSAGGTPGALKEAYQLGGDRMDRALDNLDKGESFE
jgi:hypothetical protein